VRLALFQVLECALRDVGGCVWREKVEREGLILIVNTSRLRFGDVAEVVSGVE
jgi:hypothetical protein